MSPPLWRLAGLSEEVRGEEFALDRPEMRLGRTEENDVVVPLRNLSRHHALFSLRSGALWVKDLGSKNGTFVNEQRVTEAPLHPDDIVRFAEIRFRVVRESPSASSAAEEASAPELTPLKPPSRKRGRRLYLYASAAAVAALVFGWEHVSKLLPSRVPLRPRPSAPADTSPSRPDLAPLKAADDQVLSWQVKADAAIQFDDMAAAVTLLRQVVRARPEATRAQAQLERCQQRLRAKIAEHEENGAREFEKLYYDRAIREWRKVLALSSDFDRSAYGRAEERIREAEARLTRSP